MKGKKILTAVLAAAICVGGGAGAAVAVKNTSGRTVTVMPAADFNYRGGFGMENSTQGVITSDATQDIYLYDTEKVEEVRVAEGDTVKEGDVLMIFDTEQTTRNLEMEKLRRESLQLQLDVAKKNKATLDTLVATEGESEPFYPTIDPEEDEPVIPDDVEVVAVDVLTGYTQPWNAEYGTEEDPLGTETNPYRFLCQSGATIEATFIQRMLEMAAYETPCFFALEVREGDTIDGALIRAWLQEAADLAPVAEDWVGHVDLSGESPFPGGDPAEQIQLLNERIEDLEYEITIVESERDSAIMERDQKVNELNQEIERLNKIIEELSGNSGTPTALWTDGIPVADLAVFRGDEPAAVLTELESGLIPATATYTETELAEAKKQVENQLKTLELDLRESELKIKETEKALGEGEVRAVMNGVVKKAGDPAKPPTDGTPFLQVTGEAGMYVRGGISEIYLDTLSVGDTVTVTSWMSGSVFEATVKEISPYPDTSGMFGWGDTSVTYYPYTALIADENAELTSGEWVEIATGDAGAAMIDDGRLFLWKALIRDDEGGKYVFIRGEDGRLKKQYIETGEISGSGYEIKAGLTMDDWIAFPYGKDVKEGAKTREGSSEELYEG